MDGTPHHQDANRNVRSLSLQNSWVCHLNTNSLTTLKYTFDQAIAAKSPKKVDVDMTQCHRTAESFKILREAHALGSKGEASEHLANSQGRSQSHKLRKSG